MEIKIIDKKLIKVEDTYYCITLDKRGLFIVIKDVVVSESGLVALSLNSNVKHNFKTFEDGVKYISEDIAKNYDIPVEDVKFVYENSN